MELIRPGARGSAVRDVQQRLGALGAALGHEASEGYFGADTEAAVRDFQRERRLPADGIVGVDTWGQLVEAGWTLGDRTLYLHEPFFRGDDIVALQRKLNALGFDAWREDGIHGSRVDAAVRQFQRNVGLPVDGIVGVETIEELERMRPDLGLPSRAIVREAAGIDLPTGGLAGAIIAIDPGHGPSDPGTRGQLGLAEFEATFRLAELLVFALTQRGAAPQLLRDATATPDPSTRAATANEIGAVACISIHLNDGDPAADGASCLYFGSDASSSPAGERLAESILRALVDQLGMNDCRTHPMSLALLRETRMPAIQVEPCFITNPDEEAALGDQLYCAEIASAIADGLERFLSA